MGILDRLNIFGKKEDDLSFLDTPLDSPAQNPALDPNDPGFHDSPKNPSFQPYNEQPQDDHRMRMPLGDSLRQQQNYGYNDQHAHPFNTNPNENPLKKELELISSKLDYLKASLEAVNQKLSNLEHHTRQEMEGKRW